jgi:flagellar protein FliO/FliZ
MSSTPLLVAASLPVTGAVSQVPAAIEAIQETTADGTGSATQSAPANPGATTAAQAFAARAAGQADAAPAASAFASTTQAPATGPAPQSPASAGSLGGAVFALVLVVGLILLLSWLAKRMPGLGGTGGSHSALRVVGSLALGPRDRLVVVEVGQTQLLLGVGAGGTRTLHTLDQPLPAAAAKKPSPAFAQLLAQSFGKKS